MENKIARLAYINAAESTSQLPDRILAEKEELVKELEVTKMLVIKDGQLTFLDPSNEALYRESFEDFTK